MIKTISYSKYLLNLKMKYFAKKHCYCFYFDVNNLNMKKYNDLINYLYSKNIKYLFIKNLLSTNGVLIPSFGEYLIIYSNDLIKFMDLKQFNLRCHGITFHNFFLNNNFFSNINYLNIFFFNNFIIFIGYLIYFGYIYINFLFFLQSILLRQIKKLTLNLCK